MPGEFVLAGVGGEVFEDGEWVEPACDFSRYVEVVKVTSVVFLSDDGDAEMWPDLVVGNAHTKPIRINSLELGFKSEDIAPEEATSRSAPSPSSDETAQGSIWAERSEDWQSMYEGHTDIEGGHPVYDGEIKRGDGRDNAFLYHLGEGDKHQAVVTTPMQFESKKVSANDEDPDHVWRLQDFQTLGGRESPTLLSKSECERRLESVPEGEAVDTISLRVFWSDDRLTDITDDISFHFRFAINSKIGAIQHCYAYYVLPNQSLLFESTSSNRVAEFYPEDTHWTFEEWNERYGVERAGTGQMSRSKVKGESYIFNSGTYGFPGQRPWNMTLRFVYVVLAGLITSFALGSNDVLQIGAAIAFLGALVILIYFTFTPKSMDIL